MTPDEAGTQVKAMQERLSHLENQIRERVMVDQLNSRTADLDAEQETAHAATMNRLNEAHEAMLKQLTSGKEAPLGKLAQEVVTHMRAHPMAVYAIHQFTKELMEKLNAVIAETLGIPKENGKPASEA